MRGRVNDFLRQIIALFILLLGAVFRLVFRLRVLNFDRRQQNLRRRYAVDSESPIRPFGPETKEQIDLASRKHGHKCLWATTSGTTGHPKRLLYTQARLRILKLTYIDSFVRVCLAFSIKRTSLYVFGSFDKDDSLTTLMLEDRKLPNYFTTLQAPYRIQADAAFKSLVVEYGSAAVRFWLILISNPGVLYATNPSTLVAFLDEVRSDWTRTIRLAKDWHERSQTFPAAVRRIARRIDSTGSRERTAKVARAITPLELAEWAPGVRTYMCWTGGYVRPFLERLSAYLPPERYELAPMYSMSTETVETIPSFERSETSFVPLAPGVFYEFLAEGGADVPRNILRPNQLQPGRAYTMVVSDDFGLKRYQTDDLFQCEGMLRRLPQLTFLRRRSLEYSFTGEKITGEQLTAVYEELGVDAFLTCVPCSCDTPHYRVFAVGGELNQDLSLEIENRLLAANCEYRHKRDSGRLGPITFENISLNEFLNRMPSAQSSWETQFKFLPLYRVPINCEHNN